MSIWTCPDCEGEFTIPPAPLTPGIRWAVYEAGMWCGECDPADQDDDCCVLPKRIRDRLADEDERVQR